MKIKSFDHALPYFFVQPGHGKDASGSLLEWLKPESEQTKGLLEDTLRWADDGGQMLEPGSSMAGSNSGSQEQFDNDGS